MPASSSRNTGSSVSSPRELERRIGHRFSKPRLLEEAITHKSFANENRLTYHNERLEFLGDAILNFAVSECLMNICPHSTEGELSRLRAAIVSEPTLASAARSIGLGDFIRLGRGEEQSGGRDKDSLLANCIEAIVASIYLDSGHRSAAGFVERLLSDYIKKTCASGGIQDYKTRLQEICQERLKILPEYRVVSETGPDHHKHFEVEIIINGKTLGRGSGRSKKSAEQEAAKEALEGLKDRADSRQ